MARVMRFGEGQREWGEEGRVESLSNIAYHKEATNRKEHVLLV